LLGYCPREEAKIVSDNHHNEPEQRPWFSRRGVLQAGLVAAAGIGAGGLAAADAAGQASAAVAARKHLRKPGSRPYPHLPEGTDTLPQIKHIVVLMQENHSYDNRLGMLRRAGADGFRLGADGKPLATNPYANGDIQHAFRMPTTCQLKKSPSQTWLNSHIQFEGGRNDGFVKSGSGPVSMGYWEEADQPFYYSMARVFPIGDRYFSPILGQTYPNRRYLISATSLGMVNDQTNLVTQYPPNGTIFDKLDAVKVSWRDYYSTTSTTELYLELYVNNVGKKVLPIDEFFKDAKAGTLPGFSLVEPNYNTQSEEDPQNIVVGEQFAAKVIDAVMNGPGWPHTMLIWTYDEHGGYYDHVPPPPALAPDDIRPDVPKGESRYNGFAQYGFRVPLSVVSPYARRDYVSHHVMDHTSICALAEAKWNMPAMTYRDANAWNMLDMLDLRRQAFLTPPRLDKPLLDTDPSALRCDRTGPGKIPPAGSVSPPPKK
jgi:phospholipase C